MTLPRIDLIALNGGDGAHYRYEEVAEKLLDLVYDYSDWSPASGRLKNDFIKILVENFPNDNA